MKDKTNFIQVQTLTYDELVELYMKCKKKQLAEMLAQRDIIEMTEQPLDEPYSPDKSSVPDWYHKTL